MRHTAIFLAVLLAASVAQGAAWPDTGGSGSGGGPGTDTTAIHDETDDEIVAVDEKGSPVGADVVLIEDSEASYAKKRVQLDNLPGGGSGVDINDATLSTTPDFRDNYDAEFVVCTAADTPALGCLAADDVVIAIPNKESHTHTMMEIKTPTYCIDLYDEAATPQTSGSPDQLCDFDMTIIAPIICDDR
jgi:hypothetical protein